jgi:hypothetical protein
MLVTVLAGDWKMLAMVEDGRCLRWWKMLVMEDVCDGGRVL